MDCCTCQANGAVWNRYLHARGYYWRTMRKKIKLVLFWVPCVLMTYLALTPAPPVSVYATVNDKLLHAIAYTYLAAALWWAYRHRVTSYSLVAALLIYGVLIEVVQFYIPNRVFSWLDIAANTLGILIALGIVRLYVRVRARWAAKPDDRVMVEQAQDLSLVPESSEARGD